MRLSSESAIMKSELESIPRAKLGRYLSAGAGFIIAIPRRASLQLKPFRNMQAHLRYGVQIDLLRQKTADMRLAFGDAGLSGPRSPPKIVTSL